MKYFLLNFFLILYYDAVIGWVHSPTHHLTLYASLILLLCSWHRVLQTISTHCILLHSTSFAWTLCPAWSTLFRSYLYSWFPHLNSTFWRGLSDCLHLHCFVQQALRWEPQHHLRENKILHQASFLSPSNAHNCLTLHTYFSMPRSNLFISQEPLRTHPVSRCCLGKRVLRNPPHSTAQGDFSHF